MGCLVEVLIDIISLDVDFLELDILISRTKPNLFQHLIYKIPSGDN